LVLRFSGGSQKRIEPTIPTGISLLNIVLTVSGPVSAVPELRRKEVHAFFSEAGKLACNVRAYSAYGWHAFELSPSRPQHIIHSICCSRVLFFIFESQRRMEILNLGSSGPSAPTSSIYLTSILPPPVTAQDEEIQMKDMGCADGNNGVEVVHSGDGHVGYEELLINGVDSVEERRGYYAERRTLS